MIRITEDQPPLEKEELWRVYSANQAYDAVLAGKEMIIQGEPVTIGGVAFYRERIDRQAAALKDAATVLDQGAGTGNLAMRLAKQGKQVIANDLNPFMLDHLKGKMGSAAAEITEAGGEITTANEDAINFSPDTPVEGVASNNVLYLPSINPTEFLTNIYKRCLKKGGVLVLSSFIPAPDLDQIIEAGSEELHARKVTLDDGTETDHFELLEKEIATVIQVNRILFSQMANTYSPKEIDDFLMQIGFHVQSVNRDYAGQGFTAVAIK